MFLEKMGFPVRHYLAEAGLNLFSRGPVQFRPSEIYRFGDHPSFRSMLEGTNVYLICRRRRISVDPHSIEMKGGDIYGRFVAHGGRYREWETVDFTLGPMRHGADGKPIGFTAARPADAFGHALEVVDQQGQYSFIPSCALIARAGHSLGDRTRLEVLYVGQTFGKHGNRLSVDRLSQHTTLQRILADASDDSAQDEVLLLGFQYGNSKNILSSAGNTWVDPTASSEEEQTHLMQASKQTFDRKDRVLLAEAALINYFKPRYNIMHRDSFSRGDRQKLKTLKSLLKADFTALIVEANTSNLGAKLWSEREPRGAMDGYLTSEKVEEVRINALKPGTGLSRAVVDEWIKDNAHAHTARFALYEPAERETFLHGLPWSS
ncbi:hypothetical protein [Rhodoferax sp.]|uniref:hypothetical protein n=1 Tax=Rhodoferax sp. TaxID=50421 RepID=UPI00275ACE88|nr:hypothetical protein [Rhodoferax sp.]